MSTFKFNPFPKSGGGYTTRAVFGTPVQESALTTAAATAAGVTALQAETVIKSILNGILAAGADCGYSTDLYGLVRFRPTSGGSQSDLLAFDTADEINADIALSFTAAAISEWRATLTLENMGTVGKLTPLINTVVNFSNRADNEYTAGNMLEIVGENLRFDAADTEQGVFITPEGGAEVRLTIYGRNDPGMVTALIPAGTTGALSIRIAAFINGSVRSYTYTDPVTASA